MPSPRALLTRRPSRVRIRLTLWYGGLFAVSGAVLLAITYTLVATSPRTLWLVRRRAPGTSGAGDPAAGDPTTVPPPPLPADELGRELQDLGLRQHEALLQLLLVRSGIALTVMVMISILLGWLVAGRILRPLRTMTARIRQISARNVHERLAADRPDDEIKHLSDTVDGLLERLESALGAQQRVVANAAHELRTPLTLERALLEETLMDRDADAATFRTTFERLLVLCTHQGRLLESLLTLAGSERELREREPVDLSRTAGQVLRCLRPEARRLGLRLETDIAPAPTRGDGALVERLVGNLVENALTYNVPQGRVEVTTATRAGRSVLRVVNTGPVLPPERVAGLFDPFQRMDRTAGPESHHGLGLSIVRAIAVAHDAVIDARARPDGGLSVEVAFVFTR